MVSSSSKRLRLLHTLDSHTDAVWCVSWSHDGALLASSSADKTVRVWSLKTATANDNGNGSGSTQFTCVDTLEGTHSRTVRCVDWSPDNRLLACASFDGTVSVWRKKQQLQLQQLQQQEHYNNKQQSGGGVGGGVIHFDCVATLEGHENEVKSVSWDSSGQLLATCGRDKTVWIWELLSDSADNMMMIASASAASSSSSCEFDCVSVLNGHSQDVKHVKWHPNREMLASASYDDTVRFWCQDGGGGGDDDDWFCADVLRSAAHGSTVWCVDFDRTGDRCVSVSADKSIIVWQLQQQQQQQSAATAGKPFSWRKIAVLENAHSRDIYSVSWSPVHDLIATASGDDSVRIFRLVANSGESTADLQPFKLELVCAMDGSHATDVNCVAWNPCTQYGDMVASCSDDGTVKVWQLVDNDDDNDGIVDNK